MAGTFARLLLRPGHPTRSISSLVALSREPELIPVLHRFRIVSARLLLLALAILLAILLAPSPAAAVIDLPDNFTNDVIRGGLDEPNSFAFLPDGRLLLTEQRNGKVRMLVNGAIAATDPVLDPPVTRSRSHGLRACGAMGV